jgi:Mn2+/Fe2+ NRAMP family transporter
MTIEPSTRKDQVSETITEPDLFGKGHVVKSKFWRRILLFLMVWGPGLIVMEADNDAGAMATYLNAGGVYGTHLLWVLLLLLPVTYLCQEMVVRLGIATGKGHAAMIYERFGKWWGRFSLVDLELCDVMTLVTEFAAVGLVGGYLGISKYIIVPVAAIGLVIIVITGSFLNWERFAITLSLLDIIWCIFAIEAASTWGPLRDFLFNSVVPHIPPGGFTGSLVFLIIAIIGTTVAPWQLFFQQSCIADKRLRQSNRKYEVIDTFTGAVFTISVAAGLVFLGNVLYVRHIPFVDPAQLAGTLGMGPIVKYGIMALWVDDALLGATAIALASAWAWAEVFHWKASLQNKFIEAPQFYIIYMCETVFAASVVLLPNAPLELIIIAVQVLAGMVLPVALVFLNLLLNDKALLPEKFLNKRWNNIVNWTIIAILFILSGILVLQSVDPHLFPQ